MRHWPRERAGIALLAVSTFVVGDMGFTSINESLKDFDDFINNRAIPIQAESNQDFIQKKILQDN